MTAPTTYDDVEYVLAEIITEATGEPRPGRLERTLAKSALARLREAGLALSAPTADDVREALAALKVAVEQDAPDDAYPTLVTVDKKSLADVIAAFEVRPQGTVTDAEVEPAETYAVYGGQGLRRIASGLSREEAERVSRKFEIDCMNAGLTNPPGRIEREVHP